VNGPLVVVGDLLLDREMHGTVDRLCPEAPVPVLAERSTVDRPGGAGLAALFAAQDADVVLVAAVSADAAGERLRELLAQAGVRLVAVPLHGGTPEKIRLRCGGHLLLRLDRGDGPGTIGGVPAPALAAVRSAGAVLVSDYGRGITSHPQLRAALTERAPRVPVVWDPHPKGAPPVGGTRLVTPNRAEAAGFVARADAAVVPNGNGHRHNGNGHAAPAPADSELAGSELADAAGAAVRLRRVWGAGAVVVTVAERGAVLSDGERPPLLVPAPGPASGDSCGAGDRFASTALAALAGGAPVLEAVTTAVTAATAYVAAGGALTLRFQRDRPADRERSGQIT